MKGFIEVEKMDGSRMTIAVEHIAEIHDGTPCCKSLVTGEYDKPTKKCYA